MSFNRKIIDVYFEKFSTTTVIRVFNFIHTSAFRVERLFWIVVLLGFSAATMWSVVQSVKTFLAEPTASQVSYASNATDLFGNALGLRFSDAIVCLHLRAENLWKAYEHKIDEIIAAEQNSSMSFRATLRRKIDEIHDLESARASKLNLSGESSMNATEGEMALRSYIQREESIEFTKNEVAFFSLATAMFVRLTDTELNAVPLYENWQSPSIEKLHRAFVNGGTNFTELLDLVAQMTCVLLQIRVFTVSTSFIGIRKYNVYDFCKSIASVRHFGAYYTRKSIVCYQLASEEACPLFFASSFDSFTFTLQTEGMFENSVGEAGETEIFFDLGGTFAQEQPAFPAQFDKKQIVDFSLETVNTLADLRRRRCSNRSNRRGNAFQCMVWCRLESVWNQCDCHPLGLFFIPEFGEPPIGLPSCAINLGSELGKFPLRCRQALLGLYNFPNCSVECARNCETLMFSSTVRSGDDGSLDFVNASTVVRLVSTKFVYQVVDEYVTMNELQLITSLGGNLSLYLGASFLALIHIIVFIVKLPFETTNEMVPDINGPQDVSNLSFDVAELREHIKAVQPIGEMKRKQSSA